MADAPSDLAGARDRIRESAKWLTASVGAVAAVLVAGTQLSSVGSLAVGSARFWVCVVGAAAAVLGAGLVLWWAISALTAPAVGLRALVTTPPAGTKDALSDTSLLGGYDDVTKLKGAYEKAISDRDTAFSQYRDAPSDADLRTQAQIADDRAVELNTDIANLLDVVAYQALAHRWGLARRAIVIGAVVAAIGIGAVAWAANPPDGAPGTAAEPAVLTEPTPATLQLTDAGQDALAEALGTSCPVDEPLEALVLGTDDVGADVLVDAQGCDQVRFVLVPAWGTVG